MQQSANTRQILDLDFQKELYQEDLKKLVSNIQDKQKSYNDIRFQQNELVQKIIRICYQKFEDDIIKKRIDLQELKQKSEQQKAIQDEEYSNLELELKNKIVNVFIRFQKYYEKITQEKSKLEEYIVGNLIDSEYNLILQSVHQSLTDFELAKENECINQQTFLSLKSPNVHTKQHQKMSHLNSYVNTLITKIENADQQVLNIKSENTQVQIILSQKLTSLKQYIRQLQQFNNDSVQEVFDLQSDFLTNHRNLKNNRLNIQNSFSKDEELICADIIQLEQQKSDMDKSYKSYTQVILQGNNQRKDFEENVFRLISLSNSLIQSLNNSIEQFRSQLEAFSLTPDSKTPTTTSNKKHNILNPYKKIINDKIQTEPSTYNLQKSMYFRRKPQVEKLGSIKTDENNVTSFQSVFKQTSQSPNFRNQILPEKQTALPLKCTCPPECQCQQYIQEQMHSCNNQLYINQKGILLCQVCQISFSINEHYFYCQFNKTKNKFKQFQDFIHSFQKYIISLTLNQQIVDFWIGLVINCKQQWQNGSPRLPSIKQDEIIINFLSGCPNQSNCNHKNILPQIHSICNTPLQLSNYGEVICKRCQYSIFIQYHLIQCPENNQFYAFWSVEEIILSIDPYIKQLMRQEKNDCNQFLQSLIINLNKKWK
ncbi:unnamed protein product (macronuclear) [Paramecium tetraurelia]|uniref:Uncharacterized protein n=1 Tax=Paramecium tetraurelia TaxID=5888 RepID=A0EEE1_PARTE|nr:uncharacterized protein GSPATT00026004001 [Paramecium tetraurelia]CAK93660.1 unnamed protein product [Paramecium tetraurelia]|eukprot:XP_001461055.1 hypothetical protein (macronuclear) [Paramecium tetraurelia strain d4-2]